MSPYKKKHPENENGQPAPEGEGATSENQPEGENQSKEAMVALTMDEYEALQKQVEAEATEAKEYLDSWQRERADFLNYKKRIDREQELTRTNVISDFVLKYLDLQDDLERALKSRPPELDGSEWFEGIEFIYRKLLTQLEKEGIKQMIPTAEMFDPTLHEAVVQEENPDHESGQIIEVISPGYQIGDRIIRPARVRVAR
jgi:molecular chaperone GrpE